VAADASDAADPADATDAAEATKPQWTFLTNHGHVLVCVARNPDIRLAEIADLVGIGERAAHRIVTDLVEAGYLSRTRIGRRNVYSVDLSQPLRHPLEASHAVGEVFATFAAASG
jgi:hypothetical protein